MPADRARDSRAGDSRAGDSRAGDSRAGDSRAGDSRTGRDRDREPAGRDRDAAGRARNARPRDALGRPLARGEAGEPMLPDDLQVTPEWALATAQQLLDDGRPFHAHEVLEAAWKAAEPAERDLWQGLAQLAVGLTHARRGNAPESRGSPDGRRGNGVRPAACYVSFRASCPVPGGAAWFVLRKQVSPSK